MRISSKGEYGLRALLDLAQHHGIGLIPSREIHLRQGIDENYLNQILILLRRAGLIESVRGPQGGHRLARPPAQITLLNAISALEGPLLPIDTSRDIQSCDLVDREIVRGVIVSARHALHDCFAQMTLDDLCQRKRQLSQEAMYYI